MIPRIVQMRKRRGHAGFTLIELLVVIVILGILSAVVVFAVRGVGDKGKAAANSTDQKTLRTAEEAFCARNGYYGTEQELKDQQFISDKSTLNDISLTGGGPCNGAAATHPDATGFSIGTAPTATVNVAAAQDTWIVSDSGSGPGYDSAAFAYTLNSNLYDPLIIMGSDYTLQPGLATSWELIPVGDPRKPVRPYSQATWRFHLRQGVTFHDGSSFDADDVIWTWRDRQPLNHSPLNTVASTLGFSLPYYGTNPVTPGGNPDSVEKVDQFTVDFTPKVTNLRLPEQIVHPKGAIVPMTGLAPATDPQPSAGATIARTVGKHFDGRTGGSQVTGSPSVTGTPIGTGPFKYVSYNPPLVVGTSGGDAATEAYDSYWGARAQVKRMNYSFITDPATRTAGLLSGQYDLAVDLNPLDVATVNGAGMHSVNAAYGQNLLIYVNKVVKYGPGDTPKYDITTEPAVRRALSLAIDRAAYVSTVYNGQAAPGRWMAPPNILGSHQNDVPALAYDPTLASNILDDAGWTCGGGLAGAHTPCAANETRQKGGRPLHLRLIGNTDIVQAGYDLLKANITAVGIDLQADRLTVSGRSAQYNAALFDLDLELPNQNDANPAFLPILRFACKNQTSAFRFSPPDGTNGTGASVADGANGRYPFGKTPCDPLPPGASFTTGTSTNTTAATLGPFDATHVPNSDGATTQDANQIAAAQQMKILVGQSDTNVVIPVVGQFRIYGMASNVNLGDPHPSQTSQRWVSLTKTS